MSKRIKEIHGERPSSLTDEDYQAILDAEEGIFYLTKPEMSEVEKRQAAMRIKPIADFGDMKIFDVSGDLDSHMQEQIINKMMANWGYFHSPSSVAPLTLGATTGRMANTDPDLSVIPGTEYKKKRFIGVAEVAEEPMDSEFMMRLTGDS